MDFSARPLVGDALQGQGQPCDGVDVVHLAGLQKGGDRGPCAATAVLRAIADDIRERVGAKSRWIGQMGDGRI